MVASLELVSFLKPALSVWSQTAYLVVRVVGEVIALVRTEAILEEIEVVLDLDEELVNLLLNAFEAMAGIEEGDQRVLLQTRLEADHRVRISIDDTGPGIDDQSPEVIISAFHSTKPDGLGIGLSISRTIVESHGGRTWAENIPERGATFRFTLPIADPEQAQELD